MGKDGENSELCLPVSRFGKWLTVVLGVVVKRMAVFVAGYEDESDSDMLSGGAEGMPKCCQKRQRGRHRTSMSPWFLQIIPWYAPARFGNYI
jgi:hypothetical protein